MAYSMVWDRLILTGDKDDYSSSQVKLSTYGNGRCELPPLYRLGSIPSLTESAILKIPDNSGIMLNPQRRQAKAEMWVPALLQSGWSRVPHDLDRYLKRKLSLNLKKSKI